MKKELFPYNCDVVICKSRAMVSLYEMIKRISVSNSPVLITGKTGSGKDVIAHLIHHSRAIPNTPFIAVNCGGIPENLIESELFGHEKGSFTGASIKHRGYFDLVANGVLFLDEIGELPLLQQVRLLRILDNRVFRSVGSEHDIEFKGKVVVATNQNLASLVKKKNLEKTSIIV